MLRETLHTFSLHPKKLFLIDGFGAVVSAFSLGVVLVHFEHFFGIPPSTLYFLAFLPCIFAIYDSYCYWQVNQHLDFFLRVIAFTNLSYCCLSLGLAFYHAPKLSHWAWAYILAEIIIVAFLAGIQLKVASTIKSKH